MFTGLLGTTKPIYLFLPPTSHISFSLLRSKDEGKGSLQSVGNGNKPTSHLNVITTITYIILLLLSMVESVLFPVGSVHFHRKKET
jgi:hypothetical protein